MFFCSSPQSFLVFRRSSEVSDVSSQYTCQPWEYIYIEINTILAHGLLCLGARFRNAKHHGIKVPSIKVIKGYGFKIYL